MKILNYIIVFILFLSIGLNTWFWVKDSHVEREIVKIEKTDTIRDTIIDTVPYLKKVVELKTVRDTLKMNDTVNVTVEIPIEQKIYTGENYIAYVSGYRAYLDSIQTLNTVIEKEITNTKYQKWALGPTVGIGYDIYNRHCAFLIGIGITYNILNK